MGVVPIYTFLRYSSKVSDFHGENPTTCHLTFAAKIKHYFALGDMDYDNHTGRAEQVYIYIYTYIMHIASTQSKKVMPTSLEHGLKYRCRKVNRGRHTLETRMNGTWHDIPNTTHLREKGRKKERVLKSTISKRKG